MNESLREKLNRVHLCDIGHFFLFLLAILPAAIYRCFRPHIWLICEDNEAQDNGYWFFRYLREEQPQVDAVYAIGRLEKDYPLVASLGQTVEYGSFCHWIYYLAAEVNISSQKKGKPNAAVCYVLEVLLGVLKNRRVFLQHGIITNDLPFLHYRKAKYWLFCCGAEAEYQYVKENFEYPEGVVEYTGLCRFDSLLNTEPDEALVLIVPTWRMFLQRSGDQNSFLQSSYYMHWSTLLQSESFSELLHRRGKHVIFCMHREMGAFESLFTTSFDNIRILNWSEANITSLIREASILITDYSSIFMDFAYMKRPIIYYQFDEEEFRLKHLPKGYFNYKRDGFGPVCHTKEELEEKLNGILDNENMTEEYERRNDSFFTLRDEHNCLRTYQAIINKVGIS